MSTTVSLSMNKNVITPPEATNTGPGFNQGSGGVTSKNGFSVFVRRRHHHHHHNYPLQPPSPPRARLVTTAAATTTTTFSSDA